jgi:hypothetical protein
MKERVFTDTNLNERARKNVQGCFKNVNMCFPHRNIVIAFCFHDCVGKSLTAFGRLRMTVQALYLQFYFRKVHTIFLRVRILRALYIFPT